jgi:hypothetical protein
VALFQIFIDTLANDLPSLFRIDSVHQIVSSLSQAGSINTKSMVKPHLIYLDDFFCFLVKLTVCCFAKRYCAKTPSFKKCFVEVTDAVKPCFAEKERANLKTVYNVTEQLAEFICYKEGDRIACKYTIVNSIDFRR